MPILSASSSMAHSVLLDISHFKLDLYAFVVGKIESINFHLYPNLRGFTLWKNDFELGVGGEGQNTSRNFEGDYESMRAILHM